MNGCNINCALLFLGKLSHPFMLIYFFSLAGHFCATEQNPTPAGTSMFREHMSKGMFVTYWPYGTQTEVRIIQLTRG